MNKFYRLWFLLIYAWPVALLAQGTIPGSGEGSFSNPIRVDNLKALIALILNVVVQIGLPLIILMIVYVGFLFVMARGNSDKLKEAKTALLWTVVGAAVILGAQVISNAIDATVTNLK